MPGPNFCQRSATCLATPKPKMNLITHVWHGLSDAGQRFKFPDGDAYFLARGVIPL